MEQSLEDDLRQYGLNHPEFRELLDETAQELVEFSASAPNEATISSAFDTRLAVVLNRIGIKYSPIKEQSLSIGARRLRGRVDSRVGDVIIEFKQPATFSTESQQQTAVDQVRKYARNIFEQSKRTVVAYVTDGTRVIEGSIGHLGERLGPLKPLDGNFLYEYARSVLGTTTRALTAANLVEKFTGANSPTKGLAAALHRELFGERSVGRTKMLFQEWQLLFKLAHDDTSKQKALEDRRKALEAAVGVSLDSGNLADQYRALFSLQTAYSIVLKCIGMNVLHGTTNFGTSVGLAKLAETDRSAVQRFLAAMEDGSEIRQNGVENLLEGDFFSWYAQPDQYSEAVHEAIVPIIRDIADFEALPAFQGDRVAAQDLFKDLYMNLIPEKVRHSLGEYYTPSWLADHTIAEAISASSLAESGRWRLLDPTCGSGTFLTMAMRRVLADSEGESNETRLNEVLDRVVGIDLNPLAVLTARMNYFINVAPLLERESSFHIPVYLGDASVSPKVTYVEKVECLTYEIRTLQVLISITLPRSALRDVSRFTKVMSRVELYTTAKQTDLICREILGLVDAKDLTREVEERILELAENLVELENREWNGIWPRIIADFLTTGALGEFDVIVGNPPWIDWKNLPANYRRTLVDMCVAREIFSGDGVTGGINLNVCALISLTAAENWLKPKGVLAFLMPESLLVQQSYEGFRRFKLEKDRGRLYLTQLVDWRKAGLPFKPVQQRFYTYVLTNQEPDHWPGVPVREVVKARGKKLPPPATDLAFAALEMDLFSERHSWAEQVHPGKTYFTRGADSAEVRAFAGIAGISDYRGREGIEFYPQELLLFEYVGQGKQPGTAMFRNFQSRNSKHRVPEMVREIETSMMRPLVRGPMIGRYEIATPKYFVPFYYKPEVARGRAPIPLEDLLEDAPKLAQILVANRDLFESQTEYNQRIIGEKHATAFYALARVGEYSHAPVYVTFRDNTKWGAAVISELKTPWGGTAIPVFQNHAVTICERPGSGFISEEEAHYICAVLNSRIVTRFIEQSSESRSFKIRVPVDIPLFSENNPIHRSLAGLSRNAHDVSDGSRDVFQTEIDHLVERMFTYQ